MTRLSQNKFTLSIDNYEIIHILSREMKQFGFRAKIRAIARRGKPFDWRSVDKDKRRVQPQLSHMLKLGELKIYLRGVMGAHGRSAQYVADELYPENRKPNPGRPRKA